MKTGGCNFIGAVRRFRLDLNRTGSFFIILPRAFIEEAIVKFFYSVVKILYKEEPGTNFYKAVK